MAAPRLAALLLLVACPARSWQAAHLGAEVDRIMSNYGWKVRPGLAKGGTREPEDVSVQLHVDRWEQLDDKDLTFGVDGYLRLWWFDQRLAFNASETGMSSLPFTNTQIEELWVPDIYWEQLIDITLGGQGQGRSASFWVYPDGSVFYSRQASIKIACDMREDFDDFPFDSHECQIRLGFYSMVAGDAVLSWRSNDIALPNWDGTVNKAACMAAWHVASMIQADTVAVWPSGNYSYAVADLKFTRRSTSYVLSYIVPAILLVSVSCLGFFIDPDAVPARVTLGIVALLAVATNYISLTQELEGANGGKVWLFRFVFGSYLFIVVAFLELVMVNYGHQAEQWLNAQLKRMRAEGYGWVVALHQQQQPLESFLKRWDVNGDGQISKSELRRGVAALGVGASSAEVNSFYNQIPRTSGADLVTIPAVMKALGLAIRSARPGDESRNEPGAVISPGSSPSTGRRRSSWPFISKVLLQVDGTLEEKGEESGKPNDGDAAAVQPSPPPSPPAAAQEGIPGVSNLSPIEPKKLTTCMSPRIADRATCSSQLSDSIGSNMSSVSAHSMRTRCTLDASRRQSITSKETAIQKRKLRDTRKKVQRTASAVTHEGHLWELKVFWLFPLLAKMRNLDHWARVLLPAAYMCYMLIFLAMTPDWGIPASDSPC